MRKSLAVGLILAAILFLGLPYIRLDWTAYSQGPYEPTATLTPSPTPTATSTSTPTVTPTSTLPPPQITRFQATPDTLREGESFLLEWESVHATQADLFTDGLPGGGPVPTSGSITFADVPAGTYELRLVVQDASVPPRADSATEIVTATLPGGTVIVDDLDNQFIRHGTPPFWREAFIGYRDHMFWTFVNGDTIDNWAEWRPSLTQCGTYQVSVFVPRENGTTRSARYEVHHAEGTRIVVVEQLRFSDEWVELGSYDFLPDTDGRVILTDATGEDPNSLRQIGFDAVRWDLQTRCPQKIYLPLILSYR